MVAWEVAGRTSESGRVGGSAGGRHMPPPPHPLALASQHVDLQNFSSSWRRWDGLLRPSASFFLTPLTTTLSPTWPGRTELAFTMAE